LVGRQKHPKELELIGISVIISLPFKAHGVGGIYIKISKQQ
jgi:hypothetical protein